MANIVQSKTRRVNLVKIRTSWGKVIDSVSQSAFGNYVDEEIVCTGAGISNDWKRTLDKIKIIWTQAF
jgi:hypothetical protein